MQVAVSRGEKHPWFVRIGSHVPWFLMHWLLRHWPAAFHLLQYGTLNVNDQQHWDESWVRHGKDGFRATAELAEIRRRILDLVPTEAKVLDIGCGVGEIMTLLRDGKACECFGIDIAPAAVDAVLAKGMQAKTATLPSIPYPDGAFDAAICTETLEHVTDAKSTLREIRRILKPGGILLLSVPDGSSDEETAHVHRFGRAKLDKMLSKHFAVDSIDVIQEESPSLFCVGRRLSGNAAVQ